MADGNNFNVPDHYRWKSFLDLFRKFEGVAFNHEQIFI